MASKAGKGSFFLSAPAAASRVGLVGWGLQLDMGWGCCLSCLCLCLFLQPAKLSLEHDVAMAKCCMVPVSTIPLDIFLALSEPSFTTDSPVAGYYGVALETHLKSLGREIALPIEACVMMLLASGMKEEVGSAPDPS